jgi:hypothetical protein
MLNTIKSWAQNVWYQSWTRFVAFTTMAFSVVQGSLAGMYAWVTDPTLQSFLDKMQVPHSVTVSLGILGIITWVAHGRESA